MKKLMTILVSLLVILGLAGVLAGPDWRRLIVSAPTNADVLFWSVEQRDAGFRMMDRVPFLIKARTIETAKPTWELQQAEPLELDFDLDAYFEKSRAAAVVVLHNGQIRLERYNLDFTDQGRWTSFSVAKSFTSTLVGAAIKDGFIDSIDDPVSKYIPGLKGSAYDDVSVEQLLTMSSGVAWNEDYEDPNSDVARFNNHVADDGLSNLVSYMKDLPRAHEPGTVWNYSTGETNMIGVLVSNAIDRPLADYLSEKVWQPLGMQQEATWLINPDGSEISGCCIQAATRDFARFGQFFLDGAKVNGESIVPEGWIANATTARMRYGEPGQGYGYQWWTFDDGAYTAYGIFGQSIFIDPSKNLVIATNSNWRSATGRRDGERELRAAFHNAVRASITN